MLAKCICLQHFLARWSAMQWVAKWKPIQALVESGITLLPTKWHSLRLAGFGSPVCPWCRLPYKTSLVMLVTEMSITFWFVKKNVSLPFFLSLHPVVCITVSIIWWSSQPVCSERRLWCGCSSESSCWNVVVTRMLWRTLSALFTLTQNTV